MNRSKKEEQVPVEGGGEEGGGLSRSWSRRRRRRIEQEYDKDGEEKDARGVEAGGEKDCVSGGRAGWGRG